MKINFAGEHIKLLPEKALLFTEYKILIVGDVHIGKGSDLRREGIPVPANAGIKNIRILQKLINRHQPKAIYFLGDLFHNKMNEEFKAFSDFIHANPLIEFHLILGNHDRLSIEAYEAINLGVSNEKYINNIRLQHHPDFDCNVFSISAHIHPKILIFGKGRDLFKSPVFAVKNKCMILPAFGVMTGGHYLDQKDFNEIYIIGTSILKLK